jgi:outer membrane protein assembly factor BamB
MSEYRSALRAARERIEQLEALVRAPQRQAGRVSVRRVVELLAIAVPVVAILAGVTTLARARTLGAPEHVVLPAEPPPPSAPPPPTKGLEWVSKSWYSTSFSGPFLTEPTDDGTRQIVGLAWDRERESDGLYVVAFDHDTLREAWRNGPYPAFRAREGQDTFHLTVVGERAVLTDARGTMHVLDVRTGEERATRMLANAPYAMCVAGKGASAHAIVALDGGWRARSPSDNAGKSLFAWERNKTTLALSPMTSHLSPAPAYEVCETDHYCMWNEVDGCRDIAQREKAPRLSLEVSVNEVWNAGDDRVSLGEMGRFDDAPAAAVGWTASTRAVKWEAVLVTPEHKRRADGVSHAAIDAKTFFFLYVTAVGPSRLVALDTKTGTRRFDREIPGSAIGTRIHDLVAAGNDAFVSMNDELVVIDGSTGRVRGRLRSF